MSKRATIRQGDLNRYLKAAKEHGFMVEVQGDKVRLLPTEGAAPLPSAESAEDAWDKALGLQ